VLDARVPVELLEEQVGLSKAELEAGGQRHERECRKHGQRVRERNVGGRHLQRREQSHVVRVRMVQLVDCHVHRGHRVHQPMRHVEDAVKAILTLAATDSTIGDVFNVGGVGETTVKALAEKIIKQTNSTSTITYTPYQDAYPAGFEDMQRRVPDITKIKKTINWAPTNTLDSIIDDVATSMRG
jgi:nucleoside-diphosphate-sugar epimerase